jgi:DNA-binding transcriptional LysR family regulator
MNITLRQLRAFVTVAGTGSFTAAARELHLTQSTLTKTIAEFESAVSLQFFERTTRRVRLTEDGQAFLPVAKRLLQDCDLSLEDLRQKSLGKSGTIRIACGIAFATTVLPEALKRFRASRPDVNVHLTDDTSGGVLRRLASGEADLGFGSMVSELAESLASFWLLRARLGVLFPPDSAPAPERIPLSSLHGLPLIRDSMDSSIAGALLAQGIDMRHRIKGTVEVSNLAVQFAMVRSGAGACVLSALAASHPSAEGLAFRLIEAPEIFRDIHAFHRKERMLPPAADAFVRELRATLPALGLREGVSFTR